MRNAISLFELAFGLNINLNKSSISPIYCDANRITCVAANWGIPIRFLPIHYLGVPLGSKPSSRFFWSETTEKIQKKMNSWKYVSLSRGGKITPINATLSSIPNYHFSVFKAPISIYKDVEKNWRNFLWRHTYEKKNINIIKWLVVTTPVSKGGVGISSVATTNFALLCKCLWRFYEEEDPLWKHIILAKYDQSFLGELLTKGKYSSSNAPWRSIIKGLDWVLPKIIWKINKGNSLSFRHSMWHENSPFSLHSPRLYALTTRKEYSISEMWDNSKTDWDLYPRRRLRSVEEACYYPSFSGCHLMEYLE